jgi:hypothetical protein
MACPTRSSAETSVVENMLRLRGTNDEDPLAKWIGARGEAAAGTTVQMIRWFGMNSSASSGSRSRTYIPPSRELHTHDLYETQLPKNSKEEHIGYPVSPEAYGPAEPALPSPDTV